MKTINPYFSVILLVSLFNASMLSLHSQVEDSVTRSELNALNAKMAAIEERLSELENMQSQQIDAVTKKVLTVMPKQGSSSSSLIKNVVDAVKQREQQVNFPWMDSTKWAPIREGLSTQQVLSMLGKPTVNEPSIRKWVDFVYTYQGRQPSTNKLVIGKVRFSKGVVVDFERPVIE